jgi:hypothetical protein
VADGFISYAHANRDLAHAIAEQLTAVGASVWWDRELIGGQEFGAVIERELNAAACVVVLWTEESITRRFVRDEADVAIEHRKLIPIAGEGVNPPLGFRGIQLIRLGPAGPEDAEFKRSLRRAAEELLDRTLKADAPSDARRPAAGIELSSPAYVLVPLTEAYRALVVTDHCVWLGKLGRIEARDLAGGKALGNANTLVDALFALPGGDDVVCCGSAIGYQAPDSVRVKRWSVLESDDGRRESIREVDLFVTWSWLQGPAALSEDGERIAVFVDTPERQIQVWSAAGGNDAPISVPLGDRHPDELLFLRGGGELVTIERSREATRLRVWHLDSGECVASHELDYVTINALCRTPDPRHVALGLDQSVAFLDVDDGTIGARIETDSRPVRRCAFDPENRSHRPRDGRATRPNRPAYAARCAGAHARTYEGRRLRAQRAERGRARRRQRRSTGADHLRPERFLRCRRARASGRVERPLASRASSLRAWSGGPERPSMSAMNWSPRSMNAAPRERRPNLNSNKPAVEGESFFEGRRPRGSFFPARVGFPRGRQGSLLVQHGAPRADVLRGLHDRRVGAPIGAPDCAPSTGIRARDGAQRAALTEP